VILQQIWLSIYKYSAILVKATKLQFYQQACFILLST